MNTENTNRRNFLGKLAGGTAALMGANSLAIPFSGHAENAEHPTTEHPTTAADDPEEWFRSNIKGKRKILFDAPAVNGILTMAWPKVFQMTNGMTGTAANDCSIVVVLRHETAAYALNDA